MAGTAFALILGASKALALVGASSGSPSRTGPTDAAAGQPVTHKHKKKSQQAQAASTPTATALAAPTGPCNPSDLVITPLVHKAYGGGDVTIGLSIESVTSPACTFDVGGDSVVVAIYTSTTRVWSSQDCPAVIPQVQVVARPDVPGFAHFTWNARYSSPGCPAATKWALPGGYYIDAAAFGSGSQTTKFTLLKPQPQTIAPSPSPSSSTSSGPTATTTPSPQATGKKKRG